MDAAYKGHLEVVKLLLADPRVDYNARNNEGQDAIDLAPTALKPFLARVVDARNLKPEKEDIKARLSLFEEDYAKYIHHPSRREINEDDWRARFGMRKRSSNSGNPLTTSSLE